MLCVLESSSVELAVVGCRGQIYWVLTRWLKDFCQLFTGTHLGENLHREQGGVKT